MMKILLFIYIVVFTPIVIAWTIDLPQMRRHLFENTENKAGSNFDVPGEFFYDNIEGNSKHNSREHKIYANNLEYHHDEEQRASRLAQDGGRYLEGLRRSIENYIEFVKGCTKMNYTLSLNSTRNSTWLPQLEVSDIEMGGERSPATCAEVTRAGEHARRLAELAMWATRRLQDIAYAEMYQKDVSEEEDQLIFRLASFLDGLARLTGFRPNPKKFLADPPVSSTTTQPPPIALVLGDPVGAPEEVKNALLRCLKEKSPIPATVRCAYPLPIPPAVVAIFNLTNTTSPSPPTQPLTTPEGQSLELLRVSDSPTFTAPVSGTEYPKSLSYDHAAYIPAFRFNYHGIRKRSLDTPQLLSKKERGIQKRSIDENPTINLMKYYVKHHVWKNSNPSKTDAKDSENFDVHNELHAKHKRSVFRSTPPNYRRPVHTLKLVKERIKTTLGTHFFRNREQMIKLKNTIDSIRSITYKKSVTKAKIHKRSIHYEDMFLPRIPDDPTQDISYYVKNKPGTNVSPNLLQAAQLRLGLEQVFQTGNIEVVRRYGANYNPLVPFPFYAGVLRSAADV